MYSISTAVSWHAAAGHFWYISHISTGTDRRTLVLAGGGHAHLHSLSRTARFTEKGHQVVLVNPSPYLYYSGMATGVISGIYSPEEARIDLRRLVESGGGYFTGGRVYRILPDERALLLDDGRRIHYDVASFCLGSEVPAGGIETDGEVIPVKPVENAARIRERVLNADPAPRVLVAGGGPAGCEVAANAARLVAERGEGGIALAEPGPNLLGSAPEKARREMHAFLANSGVEVLLNTRISSYKNGSARATDSREIQTDLLIPATGISPPPLFRSSGLATAGDGGMWTDRCLRSVSDGRIFGGGDAISFGGEPLPELGVFAIRQGPILYHNLQAALEGARLRPFKPQRSYLYILNLGDGTGIAVRGSLSWRGRTAMLLKHRIDKKFVESHQRPDGPPARSYLLPTPRSR